MAFLIDRQLLLARAGLQISWILFWRAVIVLSGASWIEVLPNISIFSGARERLESEIWVRYSDWITGIEQLLRSGTVPNDIQWSALDKETNRAQEIAPLCGKLLADLSETIRQRRTQGVALLPLLERIREFCYFQWQSLEQCRAKAGPVRMQALGIAGALPLLAMLLYWLLPELQAVSMVFFLGVCGLTVWSGSGCFWIYQQVGRALRGAVLPREGHFALASLLGIEAYRGALERGLPPDLAWGDLIERVSQISPTLGLLLPPGLFSVGDSMQWEGSAAAKRILQQLLHLHQVLGLSMLEGRGTSERAQNAAHLLRETLLRERERELGMLNQRLLGPLFLCGALPAFGLLIGTLALMSAEAGWDGGLWP